MIIAYTRMGFCLWGSKGIGESTSAQTENIKSKQRVSTSSKSIPSCIPNDYEPYSYSRRVLAWIKPLFRAAAAASTFGLEGTFYWESECGFVCYYFRSMCIYLERRCLIMIIMDGSDCFCQLCQRVPRVRYKTLETVYDYNLYKFKC